MRPLLSSRRLLLRTYTTKSPSTTQPNHAPSYNPSRLGPTLTLDHFIQRARVLSFYRTILRSIRRIPDPATRAETHRYARGEFERHRDVTDLDHIRYLLSTAKTEFETMERYIQQQS